MKTIMVTGIGGVVGQGILRNIRAMAEPFEIVGINVVAISAGNYLCDHVYEVPYADDPAYPQAIAELARRHDVALIIPSTDLESYHLGLHRDLFPALVATSPAEVTGMCLDKYETYRAFAAKGVRFAASALPSEYRGDFDRTVVKPRAGRGSRNIHVDPPAPTDFPDDYVVQEYLDGPELTTTFYVRQDGALHGFITLERELEHGNTSRAEVCTAHDEELGALLRQMVAAFPFRGSCNVQTRVTAAGVVPFEINCRISGTNSVRSQLGFPDVAYTVEELLLGRAPEAPRITKGSALRIILDLVYPETPLNGIRDRNDNFRIF